MSQQTIQELLREQDVALLSSLFDSECVPLFSDVDKKPAVTLRDALGGLYIKWSDLSVAWIATRANFSIIGMTTTSKKETVSNTSVTNLYTLFKRYFNQLRLASINWYSTAFKISDTPTTSSYTVDNTLLLEWVDEATCDGAREACYCCRHNQQHNCCNSKI